MKGNNKQKKITKIQCHCHHLCLYGIHNYTNIFIEHLWMREKVTSPKKYIKIMRQQVINYNSMYEHDMHCNMDYITKFFRDLLRNLDTGVR